MGDQSINQNVIDECLRIAREGNIDALYLLIERHPHVLEDIDKSPFSETPLHVAASAGQASFAVELLMLKPSFARKLNNRGFTPLHLALQEHHKVGLDLLEYRRNPDLTFQRPGDSGPTLQRLWKLVLRLVEFDKDLVRVRGKRGLTPLHYVTQIGNLELMFEFLNTCPLSILDVTSQNESPLHIAVKNNQFLALRLLRKWLYRRHVSEVSLLRERLLNLKDEEGNTVSDIEKDKAPPQLNYREIKDVLKRKCILRRTSERLKEESRNVLLVVATLLVTLTYQTILTPPGGTWQDDYNCHDNPVPCAVKPSHRSGTAIMGRGPYVILILLNVLSSSTLYCLMFSLLPRDGYSVCWLLPPSGLLGTFLLSVFVTYPSPKPLSLAIFYPLLVLVLAIVFFRVRVSFYWPYAERRLKGFHKFFNH